MKNIVDIISRHLLESESIDDYLFQYRLKIIYNPSLIGKADIEEKLKSIKKIYRKILDICYYEVKNLKGNFFNISKDEFIDNIEPIELEFFWENDPKYIVLTFKLGRILEGKFLTVDINNNNQIGFVSVRD